MPHFPRTNLAPTLGVAPELMHAPREHSPMPTPTAAAPVKKSKKLRVGLDRISLRSYEPDKKQLLKTLFGKEPNVDPYTGELLRPIADNPVSITIGH